MEKLLDAGCVQSAVVDCMFYKGSIIFIVYVDDGIFLGATDDQLPAELKLLQSLKLDIEDQGNSSDNVGVNILQHNDGSYNFFQKILIDAILKDIRYSNAIKLVLGPSHQVYSNL